MGRHHTRRRPRARERRALQRELDKQRSDQVAGQAALEENRQLRATLDIESLNQLDSKTCSIIGSSPSNFDQRVEIDCGSLDGLRVGMPVVNEAGLIGKITTLSLDTSVVMLVTDPLYSVQSKVIAEVDPVVTTTTPSTVPSGLDVEDVTTTTTTTTTTTVAPRSRLARRAVTLARRAARRAATRRRRTRRRSA